MEKPKQIISTADMLLFAGTVVLALLVGEVIVRAVPLWPSRVSGYDPQLGFSHIPGATGVWINDAVPLEFRIPVTINSIGLHDREIQLQKPAGTTRILVLGDSMTDALEVPLEDNFCKQLEQLFADSGRSVQVINSGHYGYGTDQEYLYYRDRGVRLQPDAVILAFFPGNDVYENSQPETLAAKPYFTLTGDDGLKLHNYPVPAADGPADRDTHTLQAARQFLYEHSKLYRFIGYHVYSQMPRLIEWLSRHNLVKPLPEDHDPGPYSLETPEPYHTGWLITERVISRLQQQLEDENVRFYIAIMPDGQQLGIQQQAPQGDATKWNRKLAALCREQNISCLDLLPAFRRHLEEKPSSQLFYRYDRHPTPNGHRLIALSLYEFLDNRFAAPRQ